MGCFSFMCKETDEAILSTSFDGTPVHLFLLKDGKVLEHMYGNYDSYGTVFSNNLDPNGNRIRFKWNMAWLDVCDLISIGEGQRRFNHHTESWEQWIEPKPGNGIAAIKATHWEMGDPFPTVQSEDDPNQGWGTDDEGMGDTRDNVHPRVDKPFHVKYA